MSYKNNNYQSFCNELNEVIRKYQNFLDKTIINPKIFVFETNNCEIFLSIKLKNKEENKKINEPKEKEENVNQQNKNNYQKFLKDNKPSCKENELINANSYKKMTRSLQKNDGLKFNNKLNKENENNKNKFSNSLEKVKEINEEEKPKGLFNLGLNSI